MANRWVAPAPSEEEVTKSVRPKLSRAAPTELTGAARYGHEVGRGLGLPTSPAAVDEVPLRCPVAAGDEFENPFDETRDADFSSRAQTLFEQLAAETLEETALPFSGVGLQSQRASSLRLHCIKSSTSAFCWRTKSAEGNP